MKQLCKIFICFFMLIAACMSGAMSADIACLTQIGQDNDNFISPFKDLVKDKDVLIDKQKLQEFINGHSGDFFGLVAGNVLSHCMKDIHDLNNMADITSIKIPFQIDDKKYELDVDTNKLFEYTTIPSQILVIDKRDKKPGDVIKKSDITKNYYFFSAECSPHIIFHNLSDKAAVNKAGQAAFAAYGGSENEFFLDFPVGESCRAFPGLVIGDFGGWGAEEKIITYNNFQEGRKAMKSFAEHLQNSQCGNQGLAVYQISIFNKPYTKENGTQGWGIAAGIAGGTLAYLGISAGLAAAGVSAGVISVGTAIAGSNFWNPVGWIVAGATLVLGAVLAFVPSDLADVPQVVILSDPIFIK